MMRFRPGDRVCEADPKPRDIGSSYVVTECGGDIAVCHLIHPKRGKRRLIPIVNLVHFPWTKSVERADGEASSRLADFLSKGKG